MEIYFDLTEIKEAGNDIPEKGGYISIKTSINQNNSPILIPYKNFEEIYSRSKVVSTTELPELAVGSGTTQALSQDLSTDQKPDFTEVINFLNEKIGGINEGNVAQGSNKIKIQSSLQVILELPWENVTGSSLFIIREVVCPSRNYNVKDKNDFLILVSRAHNGNNDNIQVKIEDEAKAVYEALHNNAQNSFWLNTILLSRHTSPESILELPWKKINFAHLIMHGESDGALCLESPNKDRFKDVNKFSAKNFLELIKENCLSLIFLSMCYSAGGISEESLAFQIVKNGYSKYVIGYSYPVGEDSARDFAEIFYKELAIFREDTIEDIYIASLKSYYALGRAKYIPLLYSSV